MGNIKKTRTLKDDIYPYDLSLEYPKSVNKPSANGALKQADSSNQKIRSVSFAGNQTFTDNQKENALTESIAP